MSKFRAVPSYDRPFQATAPQPRAPRGKAMGHVVYKPLLGAADTNHPLSTHKWVMFDNAQQLIQVRKGLRGLPDAVPHGHVLHHGHDIRGGLRTSSEGKMINF